MAILGRYTGWGSAFFNPRWPYMYTLCGADLATGDRDIAGSIRRILMWVTVYFLHALAGFGILIVGVGLVWPNVINERSSLRYAPMAGVVLGLALAEYSRRAGSLLDRLKSGRQKKPRS